VVVLDSNQGVEPQTGTVWRQGDKYRFPRIVFATRWTRSARLLPVLKDIVDRPSAPS